MELAVGHVSIVADTSRLAPGIKKALGGASGYGSDVGSSIGSKISSGIGKTLKAGVAGVLDALNGANFQRSGGRGKKPSPVPRPGENATAEPAQDDSSTLFGGTDGFEMDSVSIEEMNEWLGLAPA